MFGLCCAGCGRLLEADGHTGPRRWFATREVLFIEAKLMGWRDNRCPTCQEDADVR